MPEYSRLTREAIQRSIEERRQERREQTRIDAENAGIERDAKFIGWYYMPTQNHGLIFTPWYERGNGEKFYLVGLDRETNELTQYNYPNSTIIEESSHTNPVTPLPFEEYHG